MTRTVQTHLRVIGAVAMREINSQQASLAYGYAWAIVDVGLSVLGLLIIKLVIRAFNPPGLPPATYILSGSLPWFMFSSLYGQGGTAIRRNRNLLSFPIVSELDLIIGSSIQRAMTYAIALIVATTISSVWEQSPFPRLPLGIMLLVLACWILGTSFGMVMMLLDQVYAPASKFLGVVLRFGLLLSGVFIPITRFPTYIWPYLTWNPMLHVEELLRQYWFANYVSPVGDPNVVIEWVVGLTAFGLLCEKYTRSRLPLV